MVENMKLLNVFAASLIFFASSYGQRIFEEDNELRELLKLRKSSNKQLGRRFQSEETVRRSSTLQFEPKSYRSKLQQDGDKEAEKIKIGRIPSYKLSAENKFKPKRRQVDQISSEVHNGPLVTETARRKYSTRPFASFSRRYTTTARTAVSKTYKRDSIDRMRFPLPDFLKTGASKSTDKIAVNKKSDAAFIERNLLGEHISSDDESIEIDENFLSTIHDNRATKHSNWNRTRLNSASIRKVATSGFEVGNDSFDVSTDRHSKQVSFDVPIFGSISEKNKNFTPKLGKNSKNQGKLHSKFKKFKTDSSYSEESSGYDATSEVLSKQSKYKQSDKFRSSILKENQKRKLKKNSENSKRVENSREKTAKDSLPLITPGNLKYENRKIKQKVGNETHTDRIQHVFFDRDILDKSTEILPINSNFPGKIENLKLDLSRRKLKTTPIRHKDSSRSSLADAKQSAKRKIEKKIDYDFEIIKMNMNDQKMTDNYNFERRDESSTAINVGADPNPEKETRSISCSVQEAHGFVDVKKTKAGSEIKCNIQKIEKITSKKPLVNDVYIKPYATSSKKPPVTEPADGVQPTNFTSIYEVPTITETVRNSSEDPLSVLQTLAHNAQDLDFYGESANRHPVLASAGFDFDKQVDIILQQHRLRPQSDPESLMLQQHRLRPQSNPESLMLQQHRLRPQSDPESLMLQQHRLRPQSDPNSFRLHRNEAFMHKSVPKVRNTPHRQENSQPTSILESHGINFDKYLELLSQKSQINSFRKPNIGKEFPTVNLHSRNEPKEIRSIGSILKSHNIDFDEQFQLLSAQKSSNHQQFLPPVQQERSSQRNGDRNAMLTNSRRVSDDKRHFKPRDKLQAKLCSGSSICGSHNSPIVDIPGKTHAILLPQKTDEIRVLAPKAALLHGILFRN